MRAPASGRMHPSTGSTLILGDVDVVEQRRDVHRTPGDAEQPINWIAGRLRPER
jgi:hypothetical protein